MHSQTHVSPRLFKFSVNKQTIVTTYHSRMIKLKRLKDFHVLFRNAPRLNSRHFEIAIKSRSIRSKLMLLRGDFIAAGSRLEVCF